MMMAVASAIRLGASSLNVGYVGETVHNLPDPFWADVAMFFVDVALARA